MCFKANYGKIFNIYIVIYFMRRIVFILLLFFSSILLVNADSWKASVEWSATSWAKECGTSFSHRQKHFWVPDEAAIWLADSWSANCTTHTYSGNLYKVPVWWDITACKLWDRIVDPSFWKEVTSITCEKYDDTPPKVLDITAGIVGWGEKGGLSSIIAYSSYLKADVYNINFQIKKDDAHNSAKIAKIVTEAQLPDGSFKRWSPAIIHGSWYDSYTERFDFTDVDRFRNKDFNFRSYSYRIVDLCDRAWNCLSDSTNRPVFDVTYNIYANNIANLDIKKPDSDVADGKEKAYTFDLKDKYWNEIVPAQKSSWGQLRALTFQTNFTNDLYLDQYKRSGESWIYATKFYNKTPWNYTMLEIWENKNWKSEFIAPSSANTSKYWISFKPYSPTYDKNAKDGRQFVDWIMKLLTPITVYDSAWSWVKSLIPAQELQYRPKFYTDLTWSLIEKWLVVWGRQDSKIHMKTNELWILKWNIYLEYWYIDETTPWDKHKAHKNLVLNYNRDKSNNWLPIISWKKPLITNLTKFTADTADIFTSLHQKGTLSKKEDKTYFATHIKSNIEWKETVYSSFVLWMDRYVWKQIDKDNTFQRNIKIIWNTHSLYYTEVVSGDTNKNISVLWDLEKAELQKNVRKRVTDWIRWIKFPDITTDPKLVKFDINHSQWKVVWDTIYFSNLNWKNVEISLTDKYSWVKNIVVYWWNAYIKKNIIANNKKQDVLSIIAVRDTEEKWWNIFVDPSVFEIDAIMYADNSLVSYHDWKILSPWNGWTYELLKNQLYIFGSIFSNNTIWGSVNFKDWKAICPYYVKTECSVDEAQKYDLYNLRRWYENISPTDPDYKDKAYTLIIEYNPLIQYKNIPFFQLKK